MTKNKTSMLAVGSNTNYNTATAAMHIDAACGSGRCCFVVGGTMVGGVVCQTNLETAVKVKVGALRVRGQG
jgi:hypothetical protein